MISYVGYSICRNPVCRGYMSAIGTTAATNHLLLRPQSKYGLVHLIGPGISSAPSAKKCLY